MKYNVVVLSNLWDSMEQGITKEMLHPLFNAKKVGYGSRHNENMLPVGVEDFICDHVLICKEHEGENKPVCIFKIITNETLSRYNLEHPLLQMMKNQIDEDFYKTVKNEINELHKSGEKTSYSGGFTFNREILEGKEEANILKDIYCAMHYHIHRDRGIHSMYAYSLPLVKTDELFSTWGMNPIDYGNGPQMFELQGYGKMKVVPIKVVVDEFTLLTRKHAKTYQSLWENRVESNGLRKIPITVAA